ncbi:MAG: MarR family winged helix-turn-helix transcriptional regulator [Pseudomonadota bacterium]
MTQADISKFQEPIHAVQTPHNLSEHLPFLICQLSDQILLKAQKHYRRKFGLGIREWRVLTLLGLFGRCSAADMVGHASVDKTTISRALTALESKGYVQRIQDPHDARRVEVQLTKSGCALHDKMVPQSRQRAKNLEKAITVQERKQLVGILRKLKTHLDTQPF